MLAEEAKVRGDQPFPDQDPIVLQASPGDTKRLGGLVLARQLGESLMIGDSVMIEVIGLKSNSARLRIVAPRSVAVHRREVYDSIRTSPRIDSPRLASTSIVSEAMDSSGPPLEGGLVLTRRSGQTIIIGGEVAVDVVDARPGSVRLRIVAPRSVSVHRREVYDAIRAGQSSENRLDSQGNI